ncbi:alpha/beta hydrolase [Xanthobacter wiegelii]|uniref:alpha/beta hydrolase n=1 Tax=Xanthobacter wiegelii TaxID=3119913 RepID=UPI0037284A9C
MLAIPGLSALGKMGKTMIDPQLQKLLSAMYEAGFPRIGTVPIQQLRAFSRPMPATTEVGNIENILIPANDRTIGARLYRNNSITTGLIVYFHGGGWVFGSLDSVDAALRILASETNFAILSIDYRLAPENPFPAAVHDALDAYEWAANNRAALTGAPDCPLLVMGDSAGGNLAAVVAQQARLAGDTRITQQILIYPAVDGNIEALRSQKMDPPFMKLDEMIWIFDQYVAPEHRRDPRVAPALTQDLSGLPPTVVVTAEYDLLTAEGIRYAARLREAGVVVTELHYEGGVHGFFTFAPMFEIGKRALNDVARVIRATSEASAAS